MDNLSVAHEPMDWMAHPRGNDRETWIVALNGADIFSAELVAAIEGVGWRWLPFPDAHDVLMQSRPRYSLVLLSVERCTMAVYDLIRFVAGTLDLPIVVFSPASSPSDIGESLRAGGEDFIAIPYATEEVIARLNTVLRGRYRIPACAPRVINLHARQPRALNRRLYDRNRIRRNGTTGGGR